MSYLIVNISKFLFLTFVLTKSAYGSRNVSQIEFPLQSGEVNGPNGTRMVIVDTRYEQNTSNFSNYLFTNVIK